MEMDYVEVDQLIEAILFLENRPINIKQIQEITGRDRSEIHKSIERINLKYSTVSSAFMIIGNKKEDFHLTINPNLYENLEQFYDSRKRMKLSPQAMETLAIIAYKQPITKVEIEKIRGVDTGHLLRTLLELEFVKITGRKKLPGRPALYATTPKFLKYFGLLSLEDLPPIEEIGEIIDFGKKKS